MRYYIKPELNIDAFDVEDILTTSGSWFVPEEPTTEEQPTLEPLGYDEEMLEAANPYGSMDRDLDAAALAHTTLPLDGEVSGGNIVQESLNSLYENFLSRF